MGKELQCIIKHSTKDLRQTTCTVIAETKRHTRSVTILLQMRIKFSMLHIAVVQGETPTGIGDLQGAKRLARTTFNQKINKMNNKGWIKIDRSVLNHWIWQDEKYFRWWVTILLNVNFESKKFAVNSKLFNCNSGESFRSIENWSVLFSCSKPTVYKFFELLKKDSMIVTKIAGNGNRRKLLLTVVNWQKYQQMETENFTESKLEALPKVNPNKNDKKERIEKGKTNCFSTPSLDEIQSYFLLKITEKNIIKGITKSKKYIID